MHMMRMRPNVPATEAIIIVSACLFHEEEVEEGMDDGDEVVVVSWRD